jgi:transcriptional regulator with XRE-family HTH domain
LKDKSFGERLTGLRKEKKLSQIDTAPLIGISYSSLQNHEAGRLPGRRTLKKYLDFYGCDEGWLMSGKGTPLSGGYRKPYRALGSPTVTLSEAQIRMKEGENDPLIDAIAIVKEIVDYGEAEITSTLMSWLTTFQKVVRLGREAESLMVGAKQVVREKENDEH